MLPGLLSAGKHLTRALGRRTLLVVFARSHGPSYQRDSLGVELGRDPQAHTSEGISTAERQQRSITPRAWKIVKPSKTS